MSKSRRSPRWARCAAPSSAARCAHRSVQRGGSREPDRRSCAPADRCSPASSATTTRVVPQLVNALLSQHNFILLGLRGQAKTRLLRALVDAARRDDPGDAGLRDQRRPAGADLRARAGRASRPTATARRSPGSARDARYVEKLATPDVTIADMVGDIDPIKAARVGPAALERADDALRPAAARQPRHLRHQRAARPGRQDPGRPVQHPAGRRRPD